MRPLCRTRGHGFSAAAPPIRHDIRQRAGEDEPMSALGVVFLPQLPPERLRGIARAADEAGLDGVWLGGDCLLGRGRPAPAAPLRWAGTWSGGPGRRTLPHGESLPTRTS